MTWRGVEFNNGIRAAAGLAVSYTRGVAQRDYLGNTVAADTPIYDAPRALPAPRPAPVVLATTTGNTGVTADVLCAGARLDGTPYVVYSLKSTSSNSPNNIVIKLSPTFAANSFDDVTPSATNLVFDIANASGAGNILKGSTLAVGGGTRNNTTRYVPVSACCEGDTIVVLCYVSTVSGGTVDSTAIVTYNWTAGQWELLYAQPTYNANLSRVNAWARPQICYPDRNHASALTAYLVFWDYMSTSNKTYSGIVWVAPMARASAASAWEVGQVTPVTAISDSPHVAYATIPSTRGGHIHGAYITRHGASGLKMVVLDAHSAVATTRVYYRTDETVTQGYSGIRSSTTLSRSTTAFGTVDVDPALSADSTFGTTETDATAANGWTLSRFAWGDLSITEGQKGPNAMSIAPLGTDPNTFILGVDENQIPLAAMVLPTSAGNKITGRALTSAPQPLAWQPARSFLAWGFTSRTPLSDYAIMVRPSNIDGTAVVNLTAAGNWTGRTCANVLMYSVDGERWARWARPFKTISTDGAYEPSLAYVVAPDGRVLLSLDRRSDGTNTGLAIVDLGVPVVRHARPILTSPSVTQTYDNTTAAGSGNTTLTDVTSTYANADALSAGFTCPAAPTSGKVYRLTSTKGGSGTASLRFQGGASETAPGGKFAVRIWVLQLPPPTPFVDNSTAPFNTSGTVNVSAQFYSTAGGTKQTASTSITPAAYGVWQPYVLYVDRSVAGDFPSGGAFSAPCTANIAFANPQLSTQYRATDFLLAMEVMHAGGSAELPTIPPPFVSGTKQRVPGTSLSVEGFAPSATWHAAYSAMIPHNSWDSLVVTARRPSSRRLFTLWQDAGNYLAATPDTAAGTVVVTGRRTLRVTNITVSGTTATVLCPGHGFANGSTVNFTGWSDNAAATAFTIASVATDSFTMTVASSTATLPTGDIGVYVDYSTTCSAVSTERFEYYRLGMIHAIISQGASGAMAFAFSVDGTQMSRTTATWTGFALKPTRVILADETVANFEPMAVHLVAMDENGSGSYSTASAAQSFMASESIRDAAYPQTRRVFIAA